MIDYSLLNDSQRAAVFDDSPKTVVIAGPGTGKTKTLAYKFAYLLESGYRNDEVMLVTFTNAAADEMSERIEKLIHVKPMYAGTFHSIFLRLLKEYQDLLVRYSVLPQGFENFNVLDEDNQRMVFQSIVTKHGLNDSVTTLLMTLYSYLTNTMSTISFDIARRYFRINADKIAAMYNDIINDYTQFKLSNGFFDFEDILVYMYNAVSKCSVFSDRLIARFKYILVDELQDCSKLQLMIIKTLFDRANNRLKVFAVGDDAQSIYGFRGADTSLIQEFASDAHKIVFNYNYRSGKVLAGSLGLFVPSSASYRMHLPMNKSIHSDSVRLITVNCERSEIMMINHILKDLSLKQLQPKDIVILARTNAKLEQLFNGLSKYNSELLLIKTEEDFLNSLQMNKTKLMTIHRSKGLEWPAVIVAGIQDNIFPRLEGSSIEEEQRLLYVAVTRAQQYCYLIAYTPVHWAFADKLLQPGVINGLDKMSKIRTI